MKKYITLTMLVILSMPIFSQQVNPKQPLTSAKYLAKSKTQGVFGFILLGAGTTTLVILSKGNTDLDAVGPLAVMGGLSTLGSIPLFIASGRNKRKAIKALASLNFHKTESGNVLAKHLPPVPAITLKINL